MAMKIFLVVLIVSLSVPFFVIGCGENNTLKPEITVPQNRELPRIDASAPEEIETATFALG